MNLSMNIQLRQLLAMACTKCGEVVRMPSDTYTNYKAFSVELHALKEESAVELARKHRVVGCPKCGSMRLEKVES